MTRVETTSEGGNTVAIGVVVAMAQRLMEARREARLPQAVAALAPDENRALQTLLRPCIGAMGAWNAPDAPARAAEIVLQWSVDALLADAALADKTPRVWLERVELRPALALAAHYRFCEVPDFSARYYRRRGETAIENLCGLWDVGVSTLYRYLETARDRVAQLWQAQATPAHALENLRAFAIGQNTGLGDEAVAHERLAALAETANDEMSALWHWRMAGRVRECARVLARGAVALAQQNELDAHLRGLDALPCPPLDKTLLLLAMCDVYRLRHSPLEFVTHERALQLAAAANDDASLALAHSRLGRYFEGRDADRAMTFYQDAVAFFRKSPPFVAGGEEEYPRALVRLAWLYLNRNDPRAITVLEQADDLIPAQVRETRALLEQAFGAYYRRQKNFDRALEHTHHALNIYQALGDKEGALKTYINLGATYQRAEGYTQAAAYYRTVIDLMRELAHDADHLAVAHLNLGACYFSLGEYAEAVASYARALDICQTQQLAQRGGQACYNLAEAHYAWFKVSQEPRHQTLGDGFVERAINFWRSGNYLADIENARRLKADQHGRLAAPDLQSIAPRERAEHVVEMAEIDELRRALDGVDDTRNAAEAVRLRMEIARRYARIAASEGELALRVAEQRGASAVYEAGLRAVQADFARSQSRERALVAQAAKAANLPESALLAAFKHLLTEGCLTKSAYAQASQVSAATASKHLMALAQAGVLVQLGKGPSTRYVLPE